jgi:replicative DNA helicase
LSTEQLYDIESEKALLSSILVRGGGNLSELELYPEDFFHSLHKEVYSSIMELIDLSFAVDPIAVINRLKDKAVLKNESQEVQQILSLFRDAVIVQPLSYYAKRIRKFSDRRKYKKVLEESALLVATEPEDNDSLFTRVETQLSLISRAVQSRGLRLVKEDKVDLINYVKTMFETKGGVSGLSTHFHGFDQLTTGLKPHELIILAARPGYGKTTFALNIASNIAVKDKKNVAIFSLEMSRIELLIKVICSHARINSSLLKTGAIHQSDQKKLLESIIEVSSAPIYIDDSGALSIWDFKARIRQLLTNTTLSLIIVDYLQLMHDPGVKEGRQQEVASISRNLKQMAREANCPIMALSQMSRSIESRTKDQRPMLSDLRESGAIEQDADIVTFIYREDKVKSPEDVTPDMINKAEIILAKNRAGSVGSFELLFSPEYSRFDNL